MKEAISIAKGEMKPSRVFTVEPPDVNDGEFPPGGIGRTKGGA